MRLQLVARREQRHLFQHVATCGSGCAGLGSHSKEEHQHMREREGKGEEEACQQTPTVLLDTSSWTPGSFSSELHCHTKHMPLLLAATALLPSAFTATLRMAVSPLSGSCIHSPRA